MATVLAGFLDETERFDKVRLINLSERFEYHQNLDGHADGPAGLLSAAGGLSGAVLAPEVRLVESARRA